MENINITWSGLAQLNSDEYIVIDIRDKMTFDFGHVPEAVNIRQEEFDSDFEKVKQSLSDMQGINNKLFVIMCVRGEISVEIANKLNENGFKAVSFEGGYNKWLVDKLNNEIAQSQINETEKSAGEDIAADVDVQEGKPNKKKKKELTRTEQIELSIRKKFHKQLFSKFAKAINEYELVKEGDSIAVCISGGKDSMLMAKLFQELKRHNKFEFEVKFLVMDPGYSEYNRQIIENNAKILGIPIEIYESDIFDAVFNVEKSPCYLCARMRRGHLYKKAKEMGCNKIALGHHYDDVIETILMGMLYGAQVQTMMPKLHSTNFEGLELIRPMYLIREDDIKHWRDYNGLNFIQCACKFTDTCTTCNSDGTNKSKRQEVKQLIAKMKETNPFVESNIFKSVENVNIDTVVAYKKKGVKHTFLEEY